jgi:SpoIID/LytB domain protein
MERNESLYLINELPFEEYIRNVVSAEVGTNWDMEALKVQAVISRTYAISKRAKTTTTELRLDLLCAPSGLQGLFDDTEYPMLL